MLKKYKYAVIGSGMQGTALAYDLAINGFAEKILMIDQDHAKAQQAAKKINDLTDKDIAISESLKIESNKSYVEFFKEFDTICGAAHYNANVDLTHIAITSECNFCDLGGNTDVVLEQHKLNEPAKRSNVTVIPDCGLAPGLGNILAARAISKMTCEDVQIRCGGLPQNPRPPLGYRIVFSVSGLTNEYTGMCFEIKDGEIIETPAFSELEEIDFPEPVGKCEAFLTSGGTSTGPWSFKEKVKNYNYKTVRYPGHYEKMKAMIDLGLLDQRPIKIEDMEIAPRDMFHHLLENKLVFPNDKDLVVLRVTAKGFSEQGQEQTIVQEMMDFHDDETGFSAMERTTAYSAAIVAVLMTQNKFTPGVHFLENVVDGDQYVELLEKRNIFVKTKIYRPIEST